MTRSPRATAQSANKSNDVDAVRGSIARGGRPAKRASLVLALRHVSVEHSELGVQLLRSALVDQAQCDVSSPAQVEPDVGRLAGVEDAEELDDRRPLGRFRRPGEDQVQHVFLGVSAVDADERDLVGRLAEVRDLNGAVPENRFGRRKLKRKSCMSISPTMAGGTPYTGCIAARRGLLLARDPDHPPHPGPPDPPDPDEDRPVA